MPEPKKPCLHAFLIRQIDKANPAGGFTGDWECVRCKQRFKTLIARDVPIELKAPPSLTNTTSDHISYTYNTPFVLFNDDFDGN